MTMRRWLLAAGAALCSQVICADSQTEAASDFGRVDLRTDFGGRLVVGRAFVSPVADVEDANAFLRVEGNSAQEWTSSSPQWNSRQVPDGWHHVTLWEAGQSWSESLAVLNSRKVAIHEDVLTADETWGADRVHVVRHWVRIPRGRTLTIADGAVVKFCSDTGIRVDGTLRASGVIFTPVEDDLAGGDTDMNGFTPAEKDFRIEGSGTIAYEDCVLRHDPASAPISFTLHLMPGWNLVSLPAGVTDASDFSRLEALNPFTVSRWGYQRASLPLRSGAVMWIYAAHGGSWSVSSSETILGSRQDGLRTRSHFAGVRGTGSMTVGASDVRCVWEWREGRYELMQPKYGFYELQAGKGYIVF